MFGLPAFKPFARFPKNFKYLQSLVREIWPCSRGHVMAQMTDLLYSVLVSCLVHKCCRIL